MRNGRWLLVLMMAVTSWHVGNPATPAAAAGEGGRLTLELPIRLIDTRGTSGGGPKTQLPLPAGLIAITALDTAPAYQGFSVRTCGAPASPSDRRTIPTDFGTRMQVIAGADMCVYSSIATNFVVDRLGTVSDTPTIGAQQYVPVGPVTLRSDWIDLTSSQSSSLGRPPALPGTTTAVVAVHKIVGSGHVMVGKCSAKPSDFELSANYVAEAFVDFVALGPTDSLCLWSAASRSQLLVDVELVGYLATEGPDPTALPPLHTVEDEPTLEPGFAPINPDRALDTRNGIGCVVYDFSCYVPEMVWADETIEVDVGAYVSPWTTALSLNVTTTESEEDGFLTVWPCDEPRPDTSNLNWVRGENRANLVVTKVSADATVCLMTTGMTHLIVDVTGAYDFAFGEPAQAVEPHRLLDTRNAIGVAQRARVGAGQMLTLDVTGRGGVPDGIEAITMNVTAVEPLGDGFLTVWPCDQPMPNASNVNYPPGRDVPNLVTVDVSAQGTVCFYTYAATHLLADVAAWYGTAGSSGLVELSPDRILDTRNGIGAARRKVAANEVLTLQVRGRGGVGADATSVVMNMTITNPEGGGFLTVWPCDRTRPDASNLNFRSGDNVPNLVSVALSAAGTVCMSADARTDILADVAGYLTAQPTTLPVFVLR